MFRIPKHIGIIPDGNRRWAKEHGFNKEEGYSYGLKPGLQLLHIAQKYGVQELTYYGFTVDNCKRPKKQVMAFSQACVDAVKMVQQENITFRVIGNTQSTCFPTELRPYTNMELPPSDGKDKNKITVNFLINYGWEWDMKNNWASRDIPRIDLVLRWGGMCRLSGFLPIQTVYADFYTIKELWPDYKDTHFTDALQWYQAQDITLGG